MRIAINNVWGNLGVASAALITGFMIDIAGWRMAFIAPGTVYRRDDDATHSPMFHQIEAFLIDRHITLGHLKGVLAEFAERLFGPNTPVRLRPSYFPFVEPGAEVDIGCVFCKQPGGTRAGCSFCMYSASWMRGSTSFRVGMPAI